MRLRLDLEVGPLHITFDPWPDEEEAEAEDDEPRIQAVTAYEAQAENVGSHGNPELHMGFRGGYWEE